MNARTSTSQLSANTTRVPSVRGTPRDPARSLARRSARRLRRGVDPLALVTPVVVIAAWQVIISTKLVDSQYLPTPLEVLSATWGWVFGSADAQPLYDGTWITHAAASTQRVLYGFALGSAAGAIFGFIIGWFTVGARLLDPFFQILRPIPITAWLPFTVVFLGTKTISAVALIALGAFFPVLLNTIHGLRHVDPLLLRAAQMLGCTNRIRLLLRVGVPAAMPAIFTGLRLGIGLSWVLVIVAEMIAVKSGFGYVMWDAYYFMRLDVIVAAMLSVGVMGYLFDRLAVLVERRVCAWTNA